MKFIRSIMLTVLITLSVFSAVVYTACNKNKCDSVTCKNRGACDGGYCFCLTGFEGPRCATFSRDKFLYTFSGADSCTRNPYDQYQVQFLATLNDTVEMTMFNLLNNPMDSAICTMQSTDSFSFIGSNNSTTYSGWGKISNDSLWMTYHVIHDTTSYDCKYFALKLTRP